MKIYIASSFNYVQECIRLASVLEKKGYQIQCKWWTLDYKKEYGSYVDSSWYQLPAVRTLHKRAFMAIGESNAVILFAPDSSIEHLFTGANIEVGYALALGKPVIGFGNLARSAMYEPLIRIPFHEKDVPTLLECLKLLELKGMP